MAFDANYQPEWGRRAAAVAAETLGWDATEKKQAVAAYEGERAKMLVPVSG